MLDAIALVLGPIFAAAPGSLYQQIVDAVKREIRAGRFSPGSAPPSFRLLARNLVVSVTTVKRAYEELEREGVIYRRQGRGPSSSKQGHTARALATLGSTLEPSTTHHHQGAT